MQKVIFIDLDDTLYSFTDANHYAWDQTLLYIKQTLLDYNQSISLLILYNIVEDIRKKLRQQLGTTAAIHQRILIFQLLCEALNIPVCTWSQIFTDFFWNKFLEKTILYQGAYEFIETISKYYKIYIITNFVAYNQHQKIRRLEIDQYITSIISSEEAGAEKPDPQIYNYACKKININPSQAYMIGDNFICDIQGAQNYGIQTLYITPNKTINTVKNSKNFTNFYDLLDYFKKNILKKDTENYHQKI